MNLPPHPPKESFLFGNALAILENQINYFTKQKREIGNTYRLLSPFKEYYFTTEIEYIQYVLQENPKNYLKNFAYERIRFFVGNGLLTNEGEPWRKQRRLIQPAFYKEKLTSICEVMVKVIDKHLDGWKGKSTLNISSEMSKIAMNIVTNALFFSDITTNLTEISQDVLIILDIASEIAFELVLPLPLWLPLPKHLRVKKTVNRLNNILLQMIREREKRGKEGEDLLSMLLAVRDEDTGEKMPEMQLLHEVMTIFMAGHETSANGLNWAFYLLGKNLEVHKRLKTEIKTVLGKRLPTLEDLRQLPYTQQVVQEVLRLYPPAWGIGRKTIEKDKWGDYDIPANTDVSIPIYILQRDEKYWENPDVFRPERFAPENLTSEQKKAYMPFGAGQRMCIGHHFATMEMQLILAMVVQRFDLELENPLEEILIEPKITLHSKSPIYMKIK